MPNLQDAVTDYIGSEHYLFLDSDDGSMKGETVRKTLPKVGRNDPCPCGSGKKYKHCCTGLFS